ncbi:hypothetical protein RIF29_15375 [Crotalaria pallida]|uniref:Late embryogenesis abundant protein LEA-2 subgroup domain-containing protein n=1 Tax=Crotalaria pallida TaxID=3830 RepID=A0AAN9FDE9_CROPI
MAEREQVKPLAPIRDRLSINEAGTTQHPQRIRRRKFNNCCACLFAFLLLLAIIIIVLRFTIFRVREPVITMNGVNVTKLDLVNNISLIADVSIENPNFVSFKYSNTTTNLNYHGIIVGEARGPPGRAKARRTTRMNVTVDVITNRVMSNSNFSADFGSGLLTMSTFSRVPGQVKILKLFKKHVVVKMNCTITFNVTSQGIQDQNCKQKVKL